MQSMTGYGRGQVQMEGREMTVELKTVNHRFLDISMRLPRHLSFLEEPLRKQISVALNRGHVDVYVNYKNTREDAREVAVDLPLLSAYRKALAQIADESGVPQDITLSELANFPDVLTVKEEAEDPDAVTAVLSKAAALAIVGVQDMRSREGDALAEDLSSHLDSLEALAQKIAEKAPLVPAAYRDRLEARLAELTVSPVEPQRIAQEVAIFADKCAIDEELSRLSSHITQMRGYLTAKGETGRKLDFLTQELNREVNTIGSKASDVEITGAVLEAKSIIEKLREQVQNIE